MGVLPQMPALVERVPPPAALFERVDLPRKREREHAAVAAAYFRGFRIFTSSSVAFNIAVLLYFPVDGYTKAS